MAGARLNGNEFSSRRERRALARYIEKAQGKFQATVDLKPVFDEWTRDNIHVSLGAAFALLWTEWLAVNFLYSHSLLKNGLSQPIPGTTMLELAIPPVLTVLALGAAAVTLISEARIQSQHQRNWRANITRGVIARHADNLGVTPERYLELVKPPKK